MKKKVEKITAWSYSRYALHKQCPFKAKCKHILKLPDPSGPAAERGTQIHQLAEDYVKGKLKRMPGELKLFDKELKAARKAEEKYVEEQWAFTKGFGKLVDWFDWRQVWCRVKMDLGVVQLDESERRVLIAVDHKTGKVRDEEYEEQLELTAVAAFNVVPDLYAVRAQNWYLDHGPVFNNNREYLATDKAKLEAKWVRKVRPLLNDTTFPARPGQHCRWCNYARSKGGPCKLG